MAMIFIGGSRGIFELPEPAVERVSAIVAAEHGVLIGDAPGADTEVQSVLAGYGYEHVGVFHSGKHPRNNVGDWAAYRIEPPDRAQGFALHVEKDREMARRADFGLMVWDGLSTGTALNVLRLALIGSPCVVFDMAQRLVATVRNTDDWRALLRDAGPDVCQKVEARMTDDERFDAGLCAA